MNCKLKLYTTKNSTNKFLGLYRSVLKFLHTLALDFPYICLQFFLGKFSGQEETFLQTNV